MIYYFSGTGNSQWIAERIAAGLGEETTNLQYLTDEKTALETTVSAPVIGFVMPTYMGDIPWLVKRILLHFHMDPSSYVFLVMDSNNGESGNAFRSFAQAIHHAGAEMKAGFNVQMPGNCLKSSEEENRKRLAKAPQTVDEIIRQLKDRTVNYHHDGSDAPDGFVENSYFYGKHSLKRLTLMTNFVVTDECNGCGLCVKMCPVGNIRIILEKAVHGGNCAACCRCLHWCPKNATLLNVPTLKNRKQYHHPEITAKDILNAGAEKSSQEEN